MNPEPAPFGTISPVRPVGQGGWITFPMKSFRVLKIDISLGAILPKIKSVFPVRPFMDPIACDIHP